MINPYLPEPVSKAATSKTYLMRFPEFDNETVSPLPRSYFGGNKESP